MPRKVSRADALHGNVVAHVAAEKSERIMLVGIVRGPAGKNSNLVFPGEGFRNERGHLRGGRSIRRVVLVQEYYVHELPNISGSSRAGTRSDGSCASELWRYQLLVILPQFLISTARQNPRCSRHCHKR